MKKTSTRRRQVAMGLLGAALAGCGGSEAPVQIVSYRALFRDFHPWEPGTYVFRDEAGWKAAWHARMVYGQASSFPAPAVDFATELVIGVSEGVDPNYGDQLEPVQVTKEGTSVEFQYRRPRSELGGMGPGVSTPLCVFLAIPRPVEVVRFVKV